MKHSWTRTTLKEYGQAFSFSSWLSCGREFGCDEICACLVVLISNVCNAGYSSLCVCSFTKLDYQALELGVTLRELAVELRQLAVELWSILKLAMLCLKSPRGFEVTTFWD